MNNFEKFDFVVFHTPMNDQEESEMYLVVDDLASDEDKTSLEVMEMHQKLPIPCINTFRKSDFKLFYRPLKEEIELIQENKKSFLNKYFA